MTPGDIQKCARAYYNYRERLPIFTIYRPTTTDHPGKWVARLFLTVPCPMATDYVLIGDTLEQIRAAMPIGSRMLPRSNMDEPVVQENWI